MTILKKKRLMQLEALSGRDFFNKGPLWVGHAWGWYGLRNVHGGHGVYERCHMDWWGHMGSADWGDCRSAQEVPHGSRKACKYAWSTQEMLRLLGKTCRRQYGLGRCMHTHSGYCMGHVRCGRTGWVGEDGCRPGWVGKCLGTVWEMLCGLGKAYVRCHGRCGCVQ